MSKNENDLDDEIHMFAEANLEQRIARLESCLIHTVSAIASIATTANKTVLFVNSALKHDTTSSQALVKEIIELQQEILKVVGKLVKLIKQPSDGEG